MDRRTTAAEVREEFVALWGRLGPFWGIPPATARVYAFLLSLEESVDGVSIAGELAMSRGAVSMACRDLTEWGLVHADRPPGTRRVLYRVEDDPERVVRAIVQTRKRREWDPILTNVRRWRGLLGRDRSRESRAFRARLEEIEGMVGLVDSATESLLEDGFLPRLGWKALLAAAHRGTRKRVPRTRGKDTRER